MSHLFRSALVPYSASDMFKLVDNVAEYHTFLPWCSDSEELERGENEVTASVNIAKASVNQRFTTCNITEAPHRIEMNLLDGPFKTLEGKWQFDELDENACKVSLDLSYEFSNRMLGLVVGPVFDKVANTLVDSFVERAHELYGKKCETDG